MVIGGRCSMRVSAEGDKAHDQIHKAWNTREEGIK